MKKVNIPSFGFLIPREHRIRALQDIYQYINKSADELNEFMSTSPAVFRGTYQSPKELGDVAADANDYAYVKVTDSNGNTVYDHYRYVSGTGWVLEYSVASPSFTDAEWSAIRSGITEGLVADISTLKKALGGKADAIPTGTFANAPASPTIGQQYFCTDRQTSEGATDGIMIYYNGTSWVDALGRAVAGTTTA